MLCKNKRNKMLKSCVIELFLFGVCCFANSVFWRLFSSNFVSGKSNRNSERVGCSFNKILVLHISIHFESRELN